MTVLNLETNQYGVDSVLCVGPTYVTMSSKTDKQLKTDFQPPIS